ncbi:SPI-1 type III secretion system chaperone SpaK [Burkholderia ubonensis]|uniref:SPI-1 type III secretion system chaperone SpaK n=1 Tax=Burkholderia ubonensis TaxID=101571 RepID=UPI0007589DB4|nr:SPI-1 type III secretion system chaperone SpaK [Burkholderia ubonensis]KVP68627.1 type III secretion system chaperone SpaK [Burkholderia ubonensis]KVR60720.1 type III secretion system chaperone SpaK [Burkholderia ubonensis]KVW23517.1 type III secretion system chaperone SpaK [Burkholderia ubonensis]
MYTLEIAHLARAALEASGCDPTLVGALDSHSTIALDLHDLPSIYISAQDEDVWLWSLIGEHGDAMIAQRGGTLLQALMDSCAFARGGQLQLAVQDDSLALKGLVHPDYLGDGPRFSEALNGFFASLERFSRLLLQ